MLLNFSRLARLVLLSLVSSMVINVFAEDTLLVDSSAAEETHDVEPSIDTVEPSTDTAAETRNPSTFIRPPKPPHKPPSKPPHHPHPCGCGGKPQKPEEKPKPTCPCLPVPKAFCDEEATVPVYRYYDKVARDHFYSQSKPAAIRDTKKLTNEVEYEGVAWRCFAKPEEGTVPLYAYYNNEVGDNFYTVDWNECRAAASGWHYTGILCYISPVARNGTQQLFRYWSPRRTDHFYTTDWEELGCGNTHWISENSPGFVCPRIRQDDPINPCDGSLGDKKPVLGQESKVPEAVVSVSS